MVVLPIGYDARRVPSLLEAKRAWIERTTRKLRSAHVALNAGERGHVPERVRFAATNEEWTVQRRESVAARTTVREKVSGVLEIVGDTGETDKCREALRRWLVRSARSRLEPWVRELGTELGFRVGRVSVRSQRTRWASCSKKGDISLNTRLLFVQPELARHVLIHELCHTRQLNHSARFWSLLTRHDPDCARHRRELKEAWGQVPEWLIDGQVQGPPTVD